jgi:hypothetical protein
MTLYKQYKSDKNVEQQGVRIEFGPNSKGAIMAMQVARAGGSNEKYLKAGERILKPHRRQIQTETMNRKLFEAKMMEVFVDGCLLGWENIEGEDGNELEFTRENAIKLFTDLPDLYSEVLSNSNNAALFRAEINQADAGN